MTRRRPRRRLRRHHPPPPAAAPPPPPAVAAAVTRAGRTLELEASRSVLRRGRRLTLKGRLEAFSDARGCQVGQEVRIQRRSLGSVTYTTLATRRTSAGGTFSLATRPSRTYVYRARVAESDRCAGAVSNRERVNVRR